MADTKTQSMIEYLLQCPAISQSSLYFNFVNANDEDKQFVTASNDKSLDKVYIDGSEQKRFTFSIIDYRSVAYQEIPKLLVSTSENLEEYLDVQGIIEWITEQEKLKNYPDFGDSCVVESIKTLADNPNLNGIDTSVKPALAKYSISIQVDYLDKSNVIWN